MSSAVVSNGEARSCVGKRRFPWYFNAVSCETESVTPPSLLTVKEAADEMRVHPETVYRAIRARLLQVQRVGKGRSVRIDRVALRVYRLRLESRDSTG